jgi:hypothetical protein
MARRPFQFFDSTGSQLMSKVALSNKGAWFFRVRFTRPATLHLGTILYRHCGAIDSR